MDFEVDVSGEDLLNPHYTICLADTVVKGFKFGPELVRVINSRHGQGIYRYDVSKKGRSQLKIRLYCVIVYYLFKSLKNRGSVRLKLCRDFDGREADIKSSLEYFLKLLGYVVEDLTFGELSTESKAHHNAFLMRKDHNNKLNTYLRIRLDEIEEFLK